MADPAKFKGGTAGGFTATFQKDVDNLTNALNPFSEESKQVGSLPFYGTGARCLVRLGGRPIAVAQSISWTIGYQTTPITTIDSAIPWDFDVGTMTVNASLTVVVDPTQGAEVTNTLLGTMASAIHAPLVELQVLDKLGTSLFFSRGLFTAISTGVSRGQLSTITSQFTGLCYQNYVNQSFKPYSGVANGLSGFVNGLGSLVSTASGGIL